MRVSARFKDLHREWWPHALRRALALRDVTQQQIAERAGLSRVTVSLALNCKRLTPRTRARIVRALGAELEDILEPYESSDLIRSLRPEFVTVQVEAESRG